MGILSASCSAGRRLLTMQLQVNSWTFNSSFPPQIEQAVSKHSLWTMRRYSCQNTFQPSTFRPAQQLPRSVVSPPACSPRLLGRQPSAVPWASQHRPREASVTVDDVSNLQSSDTATVGPTRQPAIQQQLYTSPSAYRRSRQTSSSWSAAQQGQIVSNSQNDADLSTVPRQHQQQQLGTQAPPNSTWGTRRQISNNNSNNSQHSSRNRSSSNSLIPSQHMARSRTTSGSSSSSLSPAQHMARSRTTSSSSSDSLSPAQHMAQSRTTSSSSSVRLNPSQHMARRRTTSSSSSSSSSSKLSPAQHMAQSRITTSSSSSSSSLPLPDSSYNDHTTAAAAAAAAAAVAAAEASGNSYSGSSSRLVVAMANLAPQQQQQQRRLSMHAPTRSPLGSQRQLSNSTTPPLKQRSSSRSSSSSSTLSPIQHMAQSRSTSTLPLPEISSSTLYGYAAAGVSSTISQQQQQQQQEVVRHPGHRRIRSISDSRSSLMQQQQQQQSVQGSSSDSDDWSTYRPKADPARAAAAAASWTVTFGCNSHAELGGWVAPGLENFARRKLPEYLDHTSLIWVSVYQPGGPGTSAAIWVGQTYFETLDSSRSDHAGSDQAGSDRQQQTLDRSYPDQISNAAVGVRGIRLSSDLIRSGLEAADVADQQLQLPAPWQQQRQAMEFEKNRSGDANILEHVKVGQRQQQLQPPIPRLKQQQQQQFAAAPRQWLEVQQRPDMGLAPAAVVKGLTFARRSITSANSSSSSSSGGSDPEDMLGPTLDVDARVGIAAPVVAAFACNGVSPQTDAAVAGQSPWYDYLLLVTGDFSVLEHKNMFPNILVHCSDGRICYDSRSAADVADFVAEADKSRIQGHVSNLLRYVSDQPENFGIEWVVGRLTDRWGFEAMMRFGIDWSYMNARLCEKGKR